MFGFRLFGKAFDVEGFRSVFWVLANVQAVAGFMIWSRGCSDWIFTESIATKMNGVVRIYIWISIYIFHGMINIKIVGAIAGTRAPSDVPVIIISAG